MTSLSSRIGWSVPTLSPGRPDAFFVERPPRTAFVATTKRASPSVESARETVVQSLRFEPFMHFQLQLDHPFCMRIDSRRRAPLYVAGGRDCWLQLGNEPAILVKHGDVVFLPHGGVHRVFSDPTAPACSFEDLNAHRPKRCGTLHGLQGIGNDSLWSGSFYWSASLASHPLTASLPAMLHLRAADAESWLSPMTDLVRWMADDHSGGKGVGMAETVGVLMQHLVLDWLRRADTPPNAAGLCAADPGDSRLLPALGAIYARPAHPWTPESLAALCHMSRTTFSTRFQAQTHQSPMRYLANWRVHLAVRLLREQRLSLDQVAERVGYSTGAILARAYRRVLGVSPRSAGRESHARIITS